MDLSPRASLRDAPIEKERKIQPNEADLFQEFQFEPEVNSKRGSVNFLRSVEKRIVRPFAMGEPNPKDLLQLFSQNHRING